MSSIIGRYWKVGLSILWGIGIFLFWACRYPQALSFQEQYQLFQFTFDYFIKDFRQAGGVALYISEFLVQFYYIPLLGAAILGFVYFLLQRLTWRVMRTTDGSQYLFSFIPSILLLWLMGDVAMLLSYPVAMIIVLAMAWVMNRRSLLYDILLLPIVYWCCGPLTWLYLILRCIAVFSSRDGKGYGRYILGVLLFVYLFIIQRLPLGDMQQYPSEAMMYGCNYSMIPLYFPSLTFVIPVVVVLIVIQSTALSRWPLSKRLTATLSIVTCAILGWASVSYGYDKDQYELICYDYLIRNERWDDLIERAEKYQVHTPFSSVAVNLALAEKRQLANRMFHFYQCGPEALIMGRVRDLMSMLPSAEAFWRLGLINSAQRYMFDTQESILNGRMSGRCTKRIAECMIVNGHYKTARKQLEQLKKSLFYSAWAQEAEALLGNENAINAHPVYGRLRKLRHNEDFLFKSNMINRMFGMLFMNNKDNRMALDYFMGQLLLEGQLQTFAQNMQMVQQFGGYSAMPIGYQDAMLCIQKQGEVPNSPYREYVRRQMGK